MLNSQTHLTVTQFHQILQQTLREEIGEVQLEAEISQSTHASSGHIYLTLKDAQSQIAAVIWKSVAGRLNFKIEPGVAVVCTGEPNVYHASGRLQLVLKKIEPAGEGLLQKKFLELKAKLEREGLFDQSRKRALPFLPKGIGLVTSAKGAALHDMMVRFAERMPQVPVYLVDSRVQGEGSAAEIARAIEHLNTRTDIVDVIIVGRGGGSLEDLWAFNEEIVCRAIFASRIPVVSAVGHEVDISLSDLVADLRAPTPTAAAEIALPHRSELTERIGRQERNLLRVRDYILSLAQMVDEREQRYQKLFKSYIDKFKTMTERAEDALRIPALKRSLLQRDQYLDGLRHRLSSSLGHRVSTNAQWIQQMASRLKSVNPGNVLQRGYVMVEHDGAVLSSLEKVKSGEDLTLIGDRSRIGAKVVSVEQNVEKGGR